MALTPEEFRKTQPKGGRSRLSILREYFGYKGGVKDFLTEIRQLSEEEKDELAKMAAKEIGATLNGQ